MVLKLDEHLFTIINIHNDDNVANQLIVSHKKSEYRLVEYFMLLLTSREWMPINLDKLQNEVKKPVKITHHMPVDVNLTSWIHSEEKSAHNKF